MEEEGLFPIAAASSSSALFQIEAASADDVAASASTEWLSNASFSEALLPPVKVQESSSDASSSSEDEEAERKRKKKLKHEQHRSSKKRKRREAAEDGVIGTLKGKNRKASGGIWSGDSSARQQKEYYFDTRGDRDNLAFGSLYSLDIARHVSLQSKETILFSRTWMRRFGFMTLEADSSALDDAVKSSCRYWSTKMASLERRPDFKRLVMHCDNRQKTPMQMPLPDSFVPLEDRDAKAKPREESWNAYVLRKTRELNELTHDAPQNKGGWISLINFQDELIRAVHKKSQKLLAIDKKLAIIEKALEHHANDESLVLLYLETCRKKDDFPTLAAKWEKMIARNSGSYRLWWGYLRHCRSTFSSFSVTSVRKLYSQALQALLAARNRRYRADEKKTNELVDEELALVSVFCDLCRFEWQSGYHELAIGLFQAQLEFSLLCPAISLSLSHKLRLFEAFWNSGAPRIGEAGAVGWSSWMEREEEELQKAKEMAGLKQEEDEVWKGVSKSQATGNVEMETPQAPENTEKNNEKSNDDEDDKDEDEEEDEATLLAKLGLDLDLTKEAEVKDARIWKRWFEEEAKRDSAQWLPLRAKAGKFRTESDDGGSIEEEDELEKMVLFDDIREFVFSLWTDEAQHHLIGEFAEFCQAPLFQWRCSNSRGYKEYVNSLDTLASKFLTTSFEDQSLGALIAPVDWKQEGEGRVQFVRDAFLLLKGFMSHKLHFQEALLSLEGARASIQNMDNVGAPRTLAKTLLKMNRQDLPLWAAYASFEASTGNIEAARRVFDTALTSLSALPKEDALDASILYLAYAEVEMSAAESNANRIIYILYFLATSETFVPFAGSALTRTQLLRGHRGFSDQLQKLRESNIAFTEREASFVICAALFEQLTLGWQAATAIFESNTVKEMNHNRHLERIYLCYVSMLESQKQLVKPAHIRTVAKEGLFLYPFNLKFLECYGRISTANDTRRLMDELREREPSSCLQWLFILSWELSKAGTAAHIHGLFERAMDAAGSESALLWRCYIAYELAMGNAEGAKRVFFRAIHACPWSKALWLDGFEKLNSLLSVKEMSDLVDIMRDKELRLRTDVYEILLQEAV